jgi:hypothetical protein
MGLLCILLEPYISTIEFFFTEKKEVKNLIAVPACLILILFELDFRASDMCLVSSLVDRFLIVIFGKMDCKISSLLEILLDPLIVIFL